MQPLFLSRRNRLNRLRKQRENALRPTVQPQVQTRTCPGCGAQRTISELAKTEYVCPDCGYHLPIGAYLRLSLLLDPSSFRELWPDLTAPNALDFPGYDAKLAAQREKTSLSDAAVTALGRLDGRQAMFAVLDSRFFMGSMGVAVGEKITRAVEFARKHHLPLIIFSASGGARMQEGILSLMQMAKTAAAVRRFQEAGGLYISFFTHPTGTASPSAKLCKRNRRWCQMLSCPGKFSI